MKKTLILGLAILFFAAQAAFGADKIGFVDLQRALNDSVAGKSARDELEGIMKKFQAEIDQKVAERDKLKSELDKQALVLSSEARTQKLYELEKVDKEAERLINDANTEMQKKQREKEVVILGELEEIIEAIGKKENYTIILASDVILFSKDGIDLTGTVIERYDSKKKEKKEAPPAKKN